MQKLNSILLVDDDEITNFVNESVVKDLNVTNKVLLANNGKQALDMLTDKQKIQPEEGPCLVLLDINMPVMDGFEFLEAYQHLDEQIKNSVTIMMLTSSQNTNDISRAMKKNVAAFLTKPLDEEALENTLSKHFG